MDQKENSQLSGQSTGPQRPESTTNLMHDLDGSLDFSEP